MLSAIKCIVILLLVFTNISFASDSYNNPEFNKVILQLLITKNGMRPPLDLVQLKSILGTGKLESTAVTTTYSWIYKDRILLVKTLDGNITTKLLTGKNDGSSVSKTMEAINEKLKSATSVWFIKEIQQQLGPGYISENNKFQKYSWNCFSAVLEVLVDQNQKIISTKISYTAPSENAIEIQAPQPHPAWDIIIDHPNNSYRAWQRSFAI